MQVGPWAPRRGAPPGFGSAATARRRRARCHRRMSEEQECKLVGEEVLVESVPAPTEETTPQDAPPVDCTPAMESEDVDSFEYKKRQFLCREAARARAKQEEGTLHEALALFVAEAIGRGVVDVDAILDEAEDAGLLPDEAAVGVLASILQAWGFG